MSSAEEFEKWHPDSNCEFVEQEEKAFLAGYAAATKRAARMQREADIEIVREWLPSIPLSGEDIDRTMRRNSAIATVLEQTPLITEDKEDGGE